METLKDKVAYSIDLLKRGEKLAKALNPTDGYIVGFSGGKDSQVLLDLVKRSGVLYKAHYSVVSIDPPENVYFIRENYPEVKFVHHHPNFFRLVEQKGLPTIWHRFCCAKLKEGIGAGSVCLVGVRAEESKKRAAYTELDIRSRRKEHEGMRGKRTLQQIEENEHRCIKGKDKVMLYPLLKWTETDIWQYIKERHIAVNPLYEEHKRVGCMFCPFAKRNEVQQWCKRYPKFKERLLKSLQIYLDKREWQDKKEVRSAEDYFEWWLSGKKLDEYISLKRQTEISYEGK